jgi:hypothetical protein
MAYAAYTTTRHNLAALRKAEWRILLSPATGLNSFGLPYALDNGAWSEFASGTPFDADAFRASVVRIGGAADFIAAPDIVQGGLDSLARSKHWLPWLLERTRRVLIPVQDGESTDIQSLLSPRVGIFVGGSTEFKEATMARWAELARSHAAWCHVGRVNTVRRIALCAAAGATSFDGSSATRYVANLPKLELARRQTDLFVGIS